MRVWIVAAAALAAAGLAGCQPKNNAAMDEAAAVSSVESPFEFAKPTGRYGGLGVYPAGQGWARVAVSGQPADPAAAKTADDEHVIVVVDSKTGEVRQCGDLSGYCIAMNPWSRKLGSTQAEPVPLKAASSSVPASDAAPAESAPAPVHHRRHPASSEPAPAQ
jgi:ABC-type amino acid transport substrate-binding protein